MVPETRWLLSSTRIVGARENVSSSAAFERNDLVLASEECPGLFLIAHDYDGEFAVGSLLTTDEWEELREADEAVVVDPQVLDTLKQPYDTGRRITG